jgi:hypothetical protein
MGIDPHFMKDTHMTDEPKAKGPSHIAYQVREGAEGTSHFNRIGSAFAHKDGQGFNLQLDSVPVDGRVTLRTAKDRLQSIKSGAEKDAAPARDDVER